MRAIRMFIVGAVISAGGLIALPAAPAHADPLLTVCITVNPLGIPRTCLIDI